MSLPLFVPAVVVRDSVNLHPDPQGLPGSSVINGLANGLDSWALIAAMLGVVIGGVVWAFRHYSQNWQQAYNGRKGVMVSAVAALLIGGAPHIVSWFVQKGGGI
jgi:hypothetical protein